MNKVLYKYDVNTTLTFTDSDETGQAGRIIEGSFYNETSLLEDELSIDTMTVTVRYEGETPSLTSFTYGSQVEYYKNDILYAIYFLKDIERISKYEYTFSLQSSIGLLDDTTHYGGIYTGQTASNIMNEIIGNKITYTEDTIFSKIKVYGWLPIATRRDNLKQLLFATGGCVKKKNGIVNFSTLTVNSPTIIPSNKVYDSGKITYNAPASRIEIVEHQYSKVNNAEIKEIYAGEIVGSNFTSPRGQLIDNGAIITWDEPYHSITFEGTTLLNDEVGVNYAVVSASANATIKGKPYIHSKLIVSRDKENYSGKEKVAKVEEATLITLANSNSVAEKVMAYYDTPSTLSASIVMNDEKPLDNLTVPNQFEEESTGIVKSIEGTFGSQITKGDMEIRLGYNPPIIYGSRELVSIAVKTPPNKIVYEAGEYFDKTGMVIEATYDDGNTAIVKNYTVTPTLLTKDTKRVTITYRESGIGKSVDLDITVQNLLKNIAIITPPDETNYEIGDNINLDGMIVKAYYSDGSSKTITNYTFSPKIVNSLDDTEITISYTEAGITKTAIQEITVGETPNLIGISIITNPTKMTYKAGEYFDNTGMVVVASFDNGTSKQVSGYTYSPTDALTKNDTTITISYTRKDVTKTTTLTINIIYLTSIAITQEPTYKSYYDTEVFNTQGMEVKAYYSDDTNKVITNYTYSPSGTLPYGTTAIIVSYSEGGETQTASQPITVSIKTYDYTNSIVISESGDYTLTGIGATHRNIRVVCIGGGDGGKGGTNGSSGTAGSSGTLSTNNTTAMRDGGSGGSGGKGGTAGNSGKVKQQDFIIPSLTDTFSISIGIGGNGGASNGGTGGKGGNTTFTYENSTTNSGDGSASSTGYTNTFTGDTYAIIGEDGVNGGNGGAGAYVSSWTSTYGINYYYSIAGEDVIYNDTTYTGGARTERYSGSNHRLQGYHSPTPTFSNYSLGGGGGGAAVGVNGGNGGSSWVHTTSNNFETIVVKGAGGNGASAITPTSPTIYGCGGYGGHGGGGGGGAGGGASAKINITDEVAKDWGISSSISATVRTNSGGVGGLGSAGSAGVQGCVIIYFS